MGKFVEESLHDPQSFGQGPGLKFEDWMPSCDNVDIAKILQEVSEEVEDPLALDIQMPMEAWHTPPILCKPVNPVTAVDNLNKHQQELAEERLRALRGKHTHNDSVQVVDTETGDVPHILHCSDKSNRGDRLCFVDVEDIHGILQTSVEISAHLPIHQG